MAPQDSVLYYWILGRTGPHDPNNQSCGKREDRTSRVLAEDRTSRALAEDRTSRVLAETPWLL